MFMPKAPPRQPEGGGVMWPDGGTGMYHPHPFIGKCHYCPAASQLAQWVMWCVVWGIFWSLKAKRFARRNE